MATQTRYRIAEVSSRMRTLGYGWSTMPTGHGTAIHVRTAPDVIGTPRRIREEMGRARRIIGSAFATHRLFVGYCPIVGDTQYLVDSLEQPNARFTVIVEDKNATDEQHAAAMARINRERAEAQADWEEQERWFRERYGDGGSEAYA